MAEVIPPLQVPTSKERKYDRQLRLWAASGQAALEAAHILLINSGPGVTGVEALKNLVLPGVGNFTILDSQQVTPADLGLNFFLEENDVGQNRGERVCAWLSEMNPDVHGQHVSLTVESFFNERDTLKPYTLVLVALPIKPEILQLICEYSKNSGIPVFYFHSIGFYSQFTLQLPTAFPIVDTHPDPASISDLRLLEPWPELLKIAQLHANDIDQLDDDAHGHIPYVTILLHYLEEWKSSHDGKPPQNYKQKTEFRDWIRSKTRTGNAEGGEENFDEAVAAVLKSLNPHAPSSAVKEVLEANETRELNANSPDFWFIANAVHAFVKEHGALPLSGSLPDMKAKSADYIELQNTYKSKARADVAWVSKFVQSLEQKYLKTTPIPESEITAFCKSAAHIKLVRGRSPHIVQNADVIKWADRARFAANALSDPDSLMIVYNAFLAYDRYNKTHSSEHDVGETSTLLQDPYEVKVEKITGIARKLMDFLLNDADQTIEDPEYSEIKDNLALTVQELVRADGAELHNIAALTGGMIAQEVIKVITKQYIPVDNTCVFDGIKSKTSVLKL